MKADLSYYSLGMEVQMNLALFLVAERSDMREKNSVSPKTLLVTSALCSLSGIWEKDAKSISALTS